eukprot:COSAG03_NODE_875_length_5530_cov_16.331615_1_plen_235_part_10
MSLVAAWLTTSAGGAINLLTLSSTGNMRDQKTYTLTAGEEKIDLSQKNLGSADVTLLTAWLQRPEVTGAINFLKCANNPGMVGELYLGPSGNLKTPDVHAEVFKQLTDSLKTSKVTEVDFSSCGIGPVALGHLSEWVRDAIGAIARLVLNDNRITNYGEDLSGLTALCDVLPTLKNPISLELANCNLKVAEVNELARAMAAGAAVTSINCLANKFGEEDLATLLTAIEGTSVRSL